MKHLYIITAVVMSLFYSATALGQQICYSVDKIWDNGSHCAFTSIEQYNGEYYITFREGETHIFDSKGNAEGKVRILHSADGTTWEALPLIGKAGIDLRDPKLSIMPDGRLMVIIGGSIYRNRKLTGCEPQVMFSEDGRTFTEPQPIVIENKADNGFNWLWRVTWHEGTGYTISYGKGEGGKTEVALLSTTDGIHYKYLQSFDISGYPNEATIRFLPDGQMAVMLRRDSNEPTGYWGLSHAPYTEWRWKEMEFRIGGPDFIVLDDKRIVAGGRTHLIASAPKTSLLIGKGDGRFSEVLTLPSGGDNSYPGFLKVGNELWVCYYSSHETRNASIYLAKIPLDILK
ncbi:MAG: exo-alpha-sialidase [Rikenellaceae bacterium]|nr:exo-alpha-sialidase [Rikenellaceae bacterium]